MKIMFNPIINNISFKAPLKNIYVLGYDSSLIKFNTLKDATEYLHKLYKNPNLKMLYKIVDGEVIEVHKGDGRSYVDYDKVNMLANKLSKLRKKKPNDDVSQKSQLISTGKKISEKPTPEQKIKNTPESPANTIDTQLGYETRLRLAKEQFDWLIRDVHLDSTSDDTVKNNYDNNKKTEERVKTPQTSMEKVIVAKEENKKTKERVKTPQTSMEKVIVAKEENKKTEERVKTPQTSMKKTNSAKKLESSKGKSEIPKSHNITDPKCNTEKRTGHEIYAVNRYGKVILYSGITEAAKKIRISPADIVNCMIGIKSTASGFKFAYASSIEENADGKVTLNQDKIDEIVKSFPRKIEQSKQRMPFYIYQINKDGIKKIFVSLAQAQKMTRIPYDKLEDSLDNTDKTINGSVFLTSAQVMKLDEDGNYVEDEEKIASIIEEKFGIEN